MRFTRRTFLTALGTGGVAALASPTVAARGREALAGPPDPLRRHLADGAIRLDSNENPVGPGPRVLEAIRESLVDASRYPDGRDALADALASELGVRPNQVLLGAGSTETLTLAVQAFAGHGRAVVVGSPTFETPGNVATRIGAPLRAVRVDRSLNLDLDGMLAQAGRAGFVFLCNPNNPTGTVHSAADVQAFVEAVHRRAPDAVVLIDEAYHHYVEAPGYATAIPLALEDPRVIVARTFSKAYGLAGLRIGAAIGQATTLERMAPMVWNMAISLPGLAAATVAVGDRTRLLEERARNRAARERTRDFFAKAGYAPAASEANFFMVDVRRPVGQFRTACAERHVLVGRPFPPLDTHVRISVGTMDEMNRAMALFRQVL